MIATARTRANRNRLVKATWRRTSDGIVATISPMLATRRRPHHTVLVTVAVCGHAAVIAPPLLSMSVTARCRMMPGTVRRAAAA
jgi:hypothetical protein